MKRFIILKKKIKIHSTKILKKNPPKSQKKNITNSLVQTKVNKSNMKKTRMNNLQFKKMKTTKHRINIRVLSGKMRMHLVKISRIKKISQLSQTVTQSTLISSIQSKKSAFLMVTKSGISPGVINWKFFIYLEVILIDPPWKNEKSKNDTYSSDNTMSIQEIIELRVERLSKKGNHQICSREILYLKKFIFLTGFIFLWIQNDQMNIGYQVLSKWGYEVIDQIIWIKVTKGNIFLQPNDIFLQSFEVCLVGFKNPPGEHVEYHSKVSNNLVFANVRKKDQKPDEIYDIIELMMPGSQKIELFAKNHNLRHGWFSLGNELGENFLSPSTVDGITCNECSLEFNVGIKRFKSKTINDFDICQDCLKERNLDQKDFYALINQSSEQANHFYIKCNQCEIQSIRGLRFKCQECENFNLCECKKALKARKTQFKILIYPQKFALTRIFKMKYNSIQFPIR